MRIDLAKEADFALNAAVRVCPSRREVLADGKSIVIEPRVMQVLVALHRAQGGVVSRDDLLESCWDGRVVGDDAINRVLSRLRRHGEDDLGGAFRVETITRVGYRLVLAGGEDRPLVAAAAEPVPAIPSAWPRRAVMAGGAAVLAGAGAAGWLLRRVRPAGAEELERQAQDAIDYGTPDRLSNAIGLLRDLTAREPGRARNWGLLAIAYCRNAQQVPRPQAEQLLVRAREAQQRAFALDPDDPDAHAVPTAFEGVFGRWGIMEPKIAALDRRFPRHVYIAIAHASLVANAGFLAESLRRGKLIDPGERMVPALVNGMLLGLRQAKEFDRGDALIARAYAVMPQHYAIWFSRFRYLLYSSRVSEAKAMLADGVAKPLGVPSWNWELCRLEAAALESRAAADVDKAFAAYRQAVQIGANFLTNASVFLAEVGRTEDAMVFAERFLLGADGSLPRADYSPEQGIYRPDASRSTFFLFHDSMTQVHAHPRFPALLESIGLEAYWRARGKQPDFRA